MQNINFYGMRSIILLKLHIFFREFQYSIIAPIISSLIFLIILQTFNNYYFNEQNNYLSFIIPGLIMMILIQETYSNISETIINMKQNGSFNDILVSPMSRKEIAISFIIATTIMGILISLIHIVIIALFFNFVLFNLWIFIYYICFIALIFSCLGSIIGFISYTWEVQQSFFNFVIFPISILSGTFFSINSFVNEWKIILLLNPFFHVISNFRESFGIENPYSDIKIDILLLIFCFIVIYFTIFIFKKGYRVIY